MLQKIYPLPSKILKKNSILVGQWWGTPLIPAFGDFSRWGFLSSFGACPGTHVDKTGLELKEIHPPLFPECWN